MESNGDDASIPDGPTRRQPRPAFLPPQFVDIVAPSLKVGLYSGTVGVLAGVGGAIARDLGPVALGFATGRRWFMLGSSYWCAYVLAPRSPFDLKLISSVTRTVGFRALGGQDRMTPLQKAAVSGMAGSTAGAVIGLTRGPTTIFPAMLILGLAGVGGQVIADGSSSLQPEKSKADGKGWLSKLSPLKKMTDEEYIAMMNEKILKVEVDIALVDDRIAELRAADESSQGKGKS